MQTVLSDNDFKVAQAILKLAQSMQVLDSQELHTLCGFERSDLIRLRDEISRCHQKSVGIPKECAASLLCLAVNLKGGYPHGKTALVGKCIPGGLDALQQLEQALRISSTL